MSRVGKVPIDLPDGVAVTIDAGNQATVKGPKGELVQRMPRSIVFRQEAGQVLVDRQDDEPESRAAHGLARQLLFNMVHGVTSGYEKRLEIRGTGYRAQMQGKTLDLQLGFTHPQRREAPEGIEFDIPDQTHVIVKGIDKQLVGQVAAELRGIRPADSYKGHGVRYEGEVVRRKPGKSAVAAGAPA
ncbi:MAG TPA: 50S ribosomal protein L6 [Chloroflexi bacterium]|nr:50S ribosomal protein L6 [Chloroflexota bacterium]|tara:strand:+ start:3470 stop:4027 length:558 start_codon:yes stop_codon:yes gene_type:complete